MSTEFTPTSEETPGQAPEPESPAEVAPVAQEETAEQTEEAPAAALGAGLNNITAPEIKALLSEVGAVAKSSTLYPDGTSNNHNIAIVNIAVLIGNNHLDSGLANAPYTFTNPSTASVTEEEEDKEEDKEED